MIQVSNSAAQAIQPGQPVTFDRVKPHTGDGECFNSQLPTSIKLCGGCNAIYEIHFNGNITSDTAGASLQMAIAIAGQPLVETAMNAVPAAAGDLVNVSTSTLFRVSCCDLDRVSVINTGAVPVTIAPNSNFYIVRKS